MPLYTPLHPTLTQVTGNTPAKRTNQSSVVLTCIFSQYHAPYVHKSRHCRCVLVSGDVRVRLPPLRLQAWIFLGVSVARLGHFSFDLWWRVGLASLGRYQRLNQRYFLLLIVSGFSTYPMFMTMTIRTYCTRLRHSFVRGTRLPRRVPRPDARQ